MVYVFVGIDFGTYMLINGSDSGADTVLYYTALLKLRSILVQNFCNGKLYEDGGRDSSGV